MEEQLIKKVNSIIKDMKMMLGSEPEVDLSDAMVIDDKSNVKEDVKLDMKEDVSKTLKDIIISPLYNESDVELKDAMLVDDKLSIKSKDSSKLKYHRWTEEDINELKENYLYYICYKEYAEMRFKRKWSLIASKASQLKLTSMKKNKYCSLFLGCHVAERVLSHIYKDVERMKINNKGYDFICNKGKKIDVKASCLRKNNTYSFGLNCNKIADYFLLIGFDDRENLNPQHIWLINGVLVNEVKQLVITNSKFGLSQLTDYELIDKVKDVIDCCNQLKK